MSAPFSLLDSLYAGCYTDSWRVIAVPTKIVLSSTRLSTFVVPDDFGDDKEAVSQRFAAMSDAERNQYRQSDNDGEYEAIEEVELDVELQSP